MEGANSAPGYRGSAPYRGHGHETFQHFAQVIGGQPQIVRHAVDLHQDHVHVPLPLPVRALHLDALALNLGREHRAEPVPAVPHGLMADLDATLVQQFLKFAWRRPEITASRLISGLVLTLRKGGRFVFQAG